MEGGTDAPGIQQGTTWLEPEFWIFIYMKENICIQEFALGFS